MKPWKKPPNQWIHYTIAILVGLFVVAPTLYGVLLALQVTAAMPIAGMLTVVIFAITARFIRRATREWRQRAAKREVCRRCWSEFEEQDEKYGFLEYVLCDDCFKTVAR